MLESSQLQALESGIFEYRGAKKLKIILGTEEIYWHTV
jgi:hypothetical protein